jgi:MoaA/NifB/PqqE/SkfB family radical SAM enzyme
MAITKKCALQCEHCYEWDNLNKKDILSADNFSRMVQNLQRKGVGLIQFLGGEPLLKMDILTEVLLKADKKTDFWVVTSGFKLNAENARALKAARLTGVIVSLDHFVPEKHNQFRGFRNAYYWVEEAVKNAGETGLVTALSLCATREFISEKNLMSYMQVAKNLGVSFVQFLEPRAVGHYAGQDVALREPQLRLLESFFEKMNFTKTYRDYPIISYHGYYQRRQGCFGAGVKGLYVDTDGNMNACPFCPTNNGNLLHEDLEGNLDALVAGGCPDFPKKMN